MASVFEERDRCIFFLNRPSPPCLELNPGQAFVDPSSWSPRWGVAERGSQTFPKFFPICRPLVVKTVDPFASCRIHHPPLLQHCTRLLVREGFSPPIPPEKGCSSVTVRAPLLFPTPATDFTPPPSAFSLLRPEAELTHVRAGPLDVLPFGQSPTPLVMDVGFFPLDSSTFGAVGYVKCGGLGSPFFLSC